MPIADVLAAVAEWKNRRPLVKMFRDYDRGNHELQFATQDFRAKYGSIVRSMRENLCPPVIQAFADRVSVEKWGTVDDDDAAVTEGLDRMLGRVTRETFRCGDAFGLVWPGRDGSPNGHFHRADTFVPHVDPDDSAVLDWAAKVWQDTTTKHGRVNVYYGDRVERWGTSAPLIDGNQTDLPETANGWVRWTDDDGGDTIGHAYDAVPVCWFRREADEETGWGTSILTDVIPLQDGLNTLLAHMLVTGEAYARPFWYLLNFQPKRDNPLAVAAEYRDALADLQSVNEAPDGDRFSPTRQQIFAHDGPGPFGQLQPPNLMHLVEVQDAMAQKVARVAGIPSYYLSQASGDVPSGESLRILTARLTAGVHAFQRETAPVWRGFKQLMGMDPSAPAWSDAMPLSSSERLALASEEKALGMPPEVWLRTAGYNPGDLDEAGVTLADRVRGEANRASLAQLDDFDRILTRGQLAP